MYRDASEIRQVGGYLKILSERYRMIERRLPIFSPPKARSGVTRGVGVK